MEAKKRNFASALGQYNPLLNKQSNPANLKTSPLVQTPKTPSRTSSPNQSFSKTSVDFIKGPLASILSKHQKTQHKIEELRKEKYLKESAELKDKPTINQNSKQLVRKIQVRMIPLHLRTAKVLKDKELRMEKEVNNKKVKEDDEFAKNCTFRPSSRSRSPGLRSPEGVTKELYKWSENKNKAIAKKKLENDLKEMDCVVDKPQIDNLSARLAKSRCSTPVHERLYVKKSVASQEKSFSFKPKINENSKEIIKRSSRNSSPSGSSPRSRDASSLKGGYNINTGLSVIDKHRGYINTLEITDKNREIFTKFNIS